MKNSKCFAFILFFVQIILNLGLLSAVAAEGDSGFSGTADNKSICGRRQWRNPTGRIVGGSVPEFADYPWMAALFKMNWAAQFYSYKCGASLLNNDWAITAAHCVYNSSANDVFLSFGEYDMRLENESLPYEDIYLQKIVIHPNYNYKAKKNDIALVKFQNPIVYKEHILPICLPENNDTHVGETAIATGWGAMVYKGNPADILMAVEVPVLANDECARMYLKSGVKRKFTDNLICAGKEIGGADACQGDSGGPLMIHDNQEHKYVLIGITAWGLECGAASKPGVYTRVDHYVPWITQTLATE